MNNPTQPIEHFTLEQAVDLREKVVSDYGTADEYFSYSDEQLAALLNAAINERIGEPVGYVSSSATARMEHYGDTLLVPKQSAIRDIPAYTLKEIKP